MKDKLTLGAQLYSLRDFCRTPRKIRDTLKKVADIGYETVQISGIGEIDPLLLKQYCDENKLQAVVTHTKPDRIIDDTDAVIAEHKILDCKNIGIGSMPERFSYTPEGIRAFIKEFAPAIKKINASGMKFTYHNHCEEFQKFNGRTLMSYFAEQTEEYQMDFTLDTYWVHYGGKDVVEQIEELNGRIKVCHFKDLVMHKDEQRIAHIGGGNLNFIKIYDACKKAGVEHIMVEQDFFYENEPFSEMQKSYEYLNVIMK